MAVRIKRVYETASTEDGFRILVDRLWPRGVSKQKAQLDLWLKDVAPSVELRRWFDHDPAKFKEFSIRYRAELDKNPALEKLHKLVNEQKAVTLLYGAHDPSINHAVVLRQHLRS